MSRRSLKEPRRLIRQRRSGLVPIALGLGGLGLVIGAIWIGPRLLDWSAHRGTVEAVASELLGRRIGIDGAIHVSLLPQPSISAEKVAVADQSDGIALKAATLTLNLSLGALLTGRIAVTHLALDHPELRLPWPLPSGPTSIEPPPWLAALSADISNGTFSIGRLTIRHANFSVVTGGVDDALAMDGTAKAAGLPWKASLTLGWPAANGSAPLHLLLQSPDNPRSSVELKGRMTTKGLVDGRFSAHGTNLSALLPGPAVPFDAYGALRADGKQVRLADLRLNLGDMAASGEADLGLSGAAASAARPSLVVRLHTPMLDLTNWLATFPKASEKIMPMTLDLDADTAVYGEGLLHHFGIKLETSAQHLRVDDLEAGLPGDAAMTLAGIYDPAAAAFSGAVTFSSSAPLVTLHWLTQAHDVPDVSGALLGLRDIAFDAKVMVDPARVALVGIDGTVNDTSLSGGFVLTKGRAPRIAAGLALGRIDLAEWLPPSWALHPPRPDVLAKQIAGVSADLRLTARQLWIGGERMDRALLDADLTARGLNIRQFAGQYGGMQMLASGELTPKGAVQNARLVLAAPDGRSLAALLPPRLRAIDASFWQAPLAATVTGGGAPDALHLALRGKLGDLAFSGQPVLDLDHDRWRGVLTLQHPSAPRLLTQLGFDHPRAWLGEGSLSLVADAQMSADGWSLSPLTFSLGLLHGSARLQKRDAASPGGRQIMGEVAIDTLPWPTPDEDDPLPLGLLDGWQASVKLRIDRVERGLRPLARKVRAYADVSQGVLRLAIEQADMLGGKANGTIRVALADPPRIAVDLGLRGASLMPEAVTPPNAPSPVASALADWLPVRITATHLDAQADLAARGFSLDSWLASLNGRLGFVAQHGALPGLRLKDAAAGHTAPHAADAKEIFTGETPFDQLGASATIAQGNLAIDSLTLAGPDGGMNAHGQVDLVRGICNLALALKPAGSDAPVSALLQGPIGKPAAWVVQGAPAKPSPAAPSAKP